MTKFQAILHSETVYVASIAGLTFLLEYLQSGSNVSLGGFVVGLLIAVGQALRKANTAQVVQPQTPKDQEA